MRYVVRPRGIRRMMGVLIGGAALVSLLAPVTAQAACPTQTTSQVFQQFGDSADYFLAPNGGLESGSTGWQLSKASVVAGNEPFYVGSHSDGRSLAISRDGTAVSPSLCVGAEHPTFRFFVQQPQSWGSTDMKVYVRYITQDGKLKDQGLVTFAGKDWKTWKPSYAIDLYSKLGFSDSSRTTTARFVFKVEDKYGKPWQIDDLYLDPYRKR